MAEMVAPNLVAAVSEARQWDRLMEMVRSGVDPESVRPGECGCDQADAWNAMFEVTGGEGGVR